MKSKMLVLMCACVAVSSHAAEIPTTQLLKPISEESQASYGDYFSANVAEGGLNTAYRLFLEVTPDVTTLDLDILDAGVDADALADQRDRDIGVDAGNPLSRYQVFDNAGNLRISLTCAFGANCGCAATNPGSGGTAACAAATITADSTTYQNWFTVTTPPDGHWEVRFDMIAAGGNNNGDDVNGFGLRTTGSLPGTTDVNMYAQSTAIWGTNDATDAPFAMYPWVTSGCRVRSNDFDFDTQGSLTYTATDGTSFSAVDAALSGDGVWNTEIFGFASGSAPASGWTDTDDVDGYGVWTLAGIVGGTAIGNYGEVILGNETSASAATTAPTSVNPTGSFRLYFPADGGATAPLKPRLEQFLRYTTALAGANPPTAGQTSRYEVTVRFTNPTNYQVTNAVATSLVNPSVTFVAGSLNVSAGTTSGPTANVITWTIGTVPANTTRLMHYRVNVTGSTLPDEVTGNIAANGTSITYTDETGTQNNTLGPLCELSVRAAVATEAVIASFEAVAERGAARLVWTTSSEVATAGFNVYRWSRESKEWHLLNSEPLPANNLAAPGGRYSYFDADAGPRERYRLEEITNDGRSLVHGPFHVMPRALRQDDPIVRDLFTFTPQAPAFSSEPRSDTEAVANKGEKRSNAAMLYARERGVHSVLATELAPIFDQPVEVVRGLIESGSLNLTRKGATVSWSATRDASGLLFFAEPEESLYSFDAIYKLEPRRGRLMAAAAVAPAATGSARTFLSQVHFEQEKFSATAMPLDAESDYWFWEAFTPEVPGYVRKAVPLTIEALDTTRGATARVQLLGFSATIHGAKLYVNGSFVGESTFSMIGPAVLDASIPAGVLREGENSFEIETVRLPGSTSLTGFYLDSIDLTYSRMTSVPAAGLKLTASGPLSVTAEPAALLLDVTKPLAPTILSGATRSDSTISFTAQAGKSYFVAANAYLRPARVRPAVNHGLAIEQRGAEFLIITSASLRSAADQYAEYRRSTGLTTFVAEVDAIYDEFGDGTPSPNAIRQFIKASQQWRIRAKYILLAGNGSYDYRELMGERNLVPALMKGFDNGIFSTDQLLADVNGDGRADVSIGRVPSSTAAELLDYLAKVQAAEGLGSSAALFASDAPDRDVEFATTSEQLASSAGRSVRTDVNLAQQTLTEARARVQSGWASGLALVSWVGHGGFDRLSSSGLITSADVAALQGPRLPVVVALTCIINRFEFPGFRALGEELALRADAGAIAVIAPSSVRLQEDSAIVGSHFYRFAGSSPNAPIGDLLRSALAAAGPAGSTYSLLGDPALRVDLTSGPLQTPTGP